MAHRGGGRGPPPFNYHQCTMSMTPAMVRICQLLPGLAARRDDRSTQARGV